MKKYPFRFVTRVGQAGVVEVVRDGATERCTLPMDIIIEAKTQLTEAQIDSGIPYGLPFGEILNPKAEIALHNAGIWTLQDLYMKAQTAVGALAEHKFKLGDVIKAATDYEKQDHKTIFKAATPAPKTRTKKEKKHE